MNLKYALFFGWPMIVVGLVACGDGRPRTGTSNAAAGLSRLTGSGPPKAAASAAPDEPGPGAVAPTIENEEEPDIAYAYSPIGKRDPFRSLFEEIGSERSSEQLTELQRYEIDQLKLVAIVSRIATPYAMVEDPEGKGHSLTRGTLIGKNWGRISAIGANCITVKEEYRDYTGRKVTNTSEKCLPKQEDLKLD